MLSDAPGSSPRHTLSYGYPLARYLETLPAAEPAAVRIKRIGYLWELGYAQQYVAVSINTQGIDSHWQKAAGDLQHCTYGPLPPTPE